MKDEENFKTNEDKIFKLKDKFDIQWRHSNFVKIKRKQIENGVNEQIVKGQPVCKV